MAFFFRRPNLSSGSTSHSQPTRLQPRASTTINSATPRRPPPLPNFNSSYLSEASTLASNSFWYCGDLQLGAGVVIIQPSTELVVILSEKEEWQNKDGVKFEGQRWFLPRGRKDVGECLEDAAVREGYEESGYRCTLYPLNIPTHATVPRALDSTNKKPRYPNTEPVYISTIHNRPRRAWNPLSSQPRYNGTEYITFWYVAQIPEDAVREEGTQMEDELNYIAHLMPFEDAIAKLKSDGDLQEMLVVKAAKEILQNSKNP